MVPPTVGVAVLADTAGVGGADFGIGKIRRGAARQTGGNRKCLRGSGRIAGQLQPKRRARCAGIHYLRGHAEAGAVDRAGKPRKRVVAGIHGDRGRVAANRKRDGAVADAGITGAVSLRGQAFGRGELRDRHIIGAVDSSPGNGRVEGSIAGNADA